MKGRSQSLQSIILLLAGAFSTIYTLILDFTGSKATYRGNLLILGMVLFFLGLYLLPSKKHHRKIVYFLFLFPLLFTFAVTVIIPLILGIGYSFTDWTGIRYTKVVGLANYQAMFKDPAFIWSVLITFVFVIINVVMINLVGFLLALLCTVKMRGVAFFRAAYFLPNLIGGIVLGYIWQFVFNNVLMNYMKFSMLSQTKTAMLAITQIPGDVLEAAQIDGATALQTLFKVKLPMIASTITICTFLTLTSAFKQFDVNMALTNGTGSVADFMGSYLSNGTQMLALNIYNTAIAKNNFALAQAKAILFFIILAVISLIQVRISNSREVEM